MRWQRILLCTPFIRDVSQPSRPALLRTPSHSVVRTTHHTRLCHAIVGVGVGGMQVVWSNPPYADERLPLICERLRVVANGPDAPDLIALQEASKRVRVRACTRARLQPTDSLMGDLHTCGSSASDDTHTHTDAPQYLTFRTRQPPKSADIDRYARASHRG
jgi:hypothetical protein